jgi:hypothetical protein
MRMIRLGAMLLLLMFLASACQTTGPRTASVDTIVLPISVVDNEENRNAAAERYLQTFELTEMYERLAAGMVGKLPSQAKQILEAVLAGTDQTILDNAMKESLVRVYTADELNALAAFYGTGIGKEISQKQDKFFAQMMPILVQALLRQVLS